MRRTLLPSTDGFRSYQTWIVVPRSVAHVKRIAIRKVGRDITVVGNRNIWALLSQTDVVTVVFEPMRKQTGSDMLAARDDSKQHRCSSQGRKIVYSTNREAVPVVVSLWKNVHRFLAGPCPERFRESGCELPRNDRRSVVVSRSALLGEKDCRCPLLPGLRFFPHTKKPSFSWSPLHARVSNGAF
jgi:hypothetical protein